MTTEYGDVAPIAPEPVAAINWAEHEPIAGLPHLGRAIRDASGQPSGSPANFEQLRGCPHPGGWESLAAQERAVAVADAEAIIAALQQQYPQYGRQPDTNPDDAE